eukprot:m.51421 g.51421  ORF g.51421 m.51421 type:complete len:252 (+) comp10940_c1_seq1:33-788(+)
MTSFSDVDCDVLCELVEIAVHGILYVRDVYPSHLFEKRKKYGVPIQVARHPQLISYIASVVQQIREWMKKGMLYNVSVAIIDKDKNVIERFVFDLSHRNKHGVPLSGEELQRQFRAVLLKINVCDALMAPNKPKASTFAFYITAKDDLADDVGLYEMPWIVAEETQQHQQQQETQESELMNESIEGRGNESIADRGAEDEDESCCGSCDDNSSCKSQTTAQTLPHMLPLRSVNFGVFRLNVYIEDAYSPLA